MQPLIAYGICKIDHCHLGAWFWYLSLLVGPILIQGHYWTELKNLIRRTLLGLIKIFRARLVTGIPQARDSMWLHRPDFCGRVNPDFSYPNDRLENPSEMLFHHWKDSLVLWGRLEPCFHDFPPRISIVIKLGSRRNSPLPLVRGSSPHYQTCPYFTLCFISPDVL